jgi:hypothetical protein
LEYGEHWVYSGARDERRNWKILSRNDAALRICFEVRMWEDNLFSKTRYMVGLGKMSWVP